MMVFGNNAETFYEVSIILKTNGRNLPYLYDKSRKKKIQIQLQMTTTNLFTSAMGYLEV